MRLAAVHIAICQTFWNHLVAGVDTCMEGEWESKFCQVGNNLSKEDNLHIESCCQSLPTGWGGFGCCRD